MVQIDMLNIYVLASKGISAHHDKILQVCRDTNSSVHAECRLMTYSRRWVDMDNSKAGGRASSKEPSVSLKCDPN